VSDRDRTITAAVIAVVSAVLFGAGILVGGLVALVVGAFGALGALQAVGVGLGLIDYSTGSKGKERE
jgi:uncharacterized Tic20 family protein